MDRQHDGRKPRADMGQLNAALAQLAESLMPTAGALLGGYGWNGGVCAYTPLRAAASHGPLPHMALARTDHPACAAAPHPPAEENAAQQRAFDAVRTLLQARWPGARVHLFGSVANGLSVRHNNDIDVCLELENIALDDQVGGRERAGRLERRCWWDGCSRLAGVPGP